MARPPATVGLNTAHAFQYAAALVQDDAAPLAGNCTAPVRIPVIGVQSTVLGRLPQWRDNPEIDYHEEIGHLGAYKGPKTTEAVMAVRCRKCAACLKQRGQMWTARGIKEIRAADRTWFGTLTVAPAHRFRTELIADTLCQQRRAEPLSSLSKDDAFKVIASVLGKELTRYLKRVRTESGATLRYLLVAEAHEDGFPHFHLLLHEWEGAVRKRTLDNQWRLGFSQWRLVDQTDTRPAGYVCKYLTKSIRTRVRASNDYGHGAERRLTEKLLASTLADIRQARETRLSRKKTKKYESNSKSQF